MIPTNFIVTIGTLLQIHCNYENSYDIVLMFLFLIYIFFIYNKKF